MTRYQVRHDTAQGEILYACGTEDNLWAWLLQVGRYLAGEQGLVIVDLATGVAVPWDE